MESHSDITIFLAPCFFLRFCFAFHFFVAFLFLRGLAILHLLRYEYMCPEIKARSKQKENETKAYSLASSFCLLEMCKNAEFLFATFLYGRFCLFFNHVSECGQLTCCISVEDQRQSIHFVPFDGKRRTRTR